MEPATERETMTSRQFVQSGMASEEFRQFLIGTAVLMIGAFIVGAVVSPPDPFTQVAVTTVFLPVVLVGSYALAYRRGFEWT
jgi:Flp pilus assembly protein TadB